MNTKEEIRKAQEYLAEKKIKHVFSSLLSQVTLFRPKDPIPFFVEILKNGYDKEYVFPRLHLVICPNRELKIVVQAFAFDYNFKLFEEQSNQELKENIEKYIKETDVNTFLLMNTPKALMELIPFEKLCHEFMSCIHIHCEGEELPDIHTLSVIRYFEAQGKLCTISVENVSQADKVYAKLKDDIIFD